MFLKYLNASKTKRRTTEPINAETKCLYPGNSKEKTSLKNGVLIIMTKMKKATIKIIINEMFFSKITDKKVLVSDNEVRIKNTFPMIKEEKAMALISPAECPSFRDIR
jgi:hypothetical protein